MLLFIRVSIVNIFAIIIFLIVDVGLSPQCVCDLQIFVVRNLHSLLLEKYSINNTSGEFYINLHNTSLLCLTELAR